MLRRFLATDDDWSGLVLRITLGGVFFPHGAQKALGWFGGNGLEGTLHHFTQNMGLPLVVAALVIAAEFLGALGLVAGFLTRLCALGILAVMAGAVAMVHWQYGFFMNWFGQKAGEGFEFHLLAMGMALALLIRGGGRWSLDRRLAGR